MAIEQTKFALTSKTIIGALLVIAAPLVDKYLGTSIDAQLQMDISTAAAAIVVQFGAVLAIYGRIKASKKLIL